MMIAFTIKTQARIYDASNEMRQGKQSNILNILKIKFLFPFIATKGIDILGRVDLDLAVIKFGHVFRNLHKLNML